MASGVEAARRQPAGAVDIGMRHGSARIGLEGERLCHPAGAEIIDQQVVTALGGVGEAVKEAVGALQHGARADEARARHQGGAQTGLRRPAGMHALGPGALGEIFDDARRHAAGDAERIHDAAAVEPQRRRHAGRRRQRTEHGGRVKARLVDQFWRDEAQPAHGLDADRDAAQRRGALGAVALAGGEHRRHDDGAGMHRAAFKRVVEILAMDGGAVDQRRAGRA